MAWVATAYADGKVTRFHSSTDGRHGNHAVHVKGWHDERGDWRDYDRPIHVMVHDNTADGLTSDEVRKVAETACHQPVYWSDGLCRNWMYDFRVWDHWCEMVDVPDGFIHINVYE